MIGNISIKIRNMAWLCYNVSRVNSIDIPGPFGAFILLISKLQTHHRVFIVGALQS